MGMGRSQEEAKLAVQTGYWPLYRYNPELTREKKNPFQLDCKAPTVDIQEFLRDEVRFASLEKKDPEASRRLREELARAYAERYAMFRQLADLPFPDPENFK